SSKLVRCRWSVVGSHSVLRTTDHQRQTTPYPILLISVNIGRDMATTMPPMTTPRVKIMNRPGRLAKAANPEGAAAPVESADLVLVELGDLVEHRVERTGLLADADHLHDHVREHLGVAERLDQGLTAFHALARLDDDVLNDGVAGGPRRDVEALEDRDARGGQGRERPAEPGHRDLAQDHS